MAGVLVRDLQCPMCARLWRDYMRAVATQFKSETGVRSAALKEDVAELERLTIMAESSSELRELARALIQRHEHDAHR
jgi:hypothetical protein